MKYLRGYLVAGVIGALAWVLTEFGKRYTTLVDMVYPYVMRTFQGFLAQWSGGVSFLVWQLLAVVLGVIALAALVITIVLKRNPVGYVGWMAAMLSVVYLLHTAMFGLSYYSGPISEDLRFDVGGYSLNELVEAAEYYRDKANVLSEQVARDQNGRAKFADFDTLAADAGEGFRVLTYEYHYPVFAGSTLPVKKLGWADMYTSMGITGFTTGITGEAAVNPQIPDVSLPFTMCHEMSHRMCIANERDANFAAFLACSVHPSLEFQYSGYYMAYRYCYNALVGAGSADALNAAKALSDGVSGKFKVDLLYYDDFFSSRKDVKATELANQVNDTYLKVSGDEKGIQSYGEVCDLLVNWHIETVVLPELTITQEPFDPYDETKVDLSGIVNAGGNP